MPFPEQISATMSTSPASSNVRHLDMLRYKPFTDAGSEIRLLRVETAESGAPPRCHLIHARLGAAPRYTALSYAWGSEPIWSALTIGRSQYSVNAAAASALQHLQSQDGEEYVWIDQICINQADAAEKSVQVKTFITLLSTPLGPPRGLHRPNFTYIESPYSALYLTLFSSSRMQLWRRGSSRKSRLH